MKIHLLAAAAVASMGMAAATSASAVINAPVPVANFINYGGLDWAWAAPCAPYAPSCGSTALTAYQITQGWRIPTRAEFLARPEVTNFGTVVSFACASEYFGSGHNHCDYGDPDSGFGQINGVKPHGYLFDYGYGITANGSDSLAETWFVRGGAAVPEPATWALMITGFGLVGATLRRRRAVAA